MGSLRVIAAAVMVAIPASVHAQATAMQRGCSGPDGVPNDSLRAIAKRLHPDAFKPENMKSSVLIGLLFDAQCQVVRHAMGYRVTDQLHVDSAFSTLYPSAKPGEFAIDKFSISGFMDLGERGATGPAPGSPLLAWGIMPSAAKRP